MTRVEMIREQKKVIKPATGQSVENLGLAIEELEERITPGLRLINHNETLLRMQAHTLGLGIEELEERITPGIRLLNHNETLLQGQKKVVKASTGRNGDAIELMVEELEERITPGIRLPNHNENLLTVHE